MLPEDCPLPSVTPTLDALVSGWRSHFWSADHEIQWLQAEQPLSAWLAPDVLLVGVVDAIGKASDGSPFFGEWKTANPREKKTWKQVWRKNPQSLTYGVLLNEAGQGGRRFTVRKAFKETPPTFDHAWYSYSESELAHWKTELLHLAGEIADLAKCAPKGPWSTNFRSCFKFGINYVCPFFEQGCDKEKWDFVPLNALEWAVAPFQRWGMTMPNGPQLAVDEAVRRLNTHEGRPVVVLSASQVETWLRCRERFRKHYVEGIVTPATEAMQLGSDFHSQLGSYYKELINGRAGG